MRDQIFINSKMAKKMTIISARVCSEEKRERKGKERKGDNKNKSIFNIKQDGPKIHLNL